MKNIIKISIFYILNFFAQKCVVKSVQALWICFENYLGEFVEHWNQLIFGDYLLVLESFFLLSFGIYLQEQSMKIAQSKIVTKNTSV